MKVGDLVTIENQTWTADPFVVLEKSWITDNWVLFHPDTGKIIWHSQRLKVVSEGR